MRYFFGTITIGAYFVIANMLFGYISPTMILFGLPCPACGLTRAGWLLFTGNIAESFAMHPMFVPAFVFALWAVWMKFCRPYALKKLQNPAILLLLGAFALYIFRMATMFPYHPPMEGNDNAVLFNIASII